MQFSHFQENAHNYIHKFYDELLIEMENRPVSSYSIIFDDEHARINRYIRGLVKEISFAVKDEMDGRFAEAEADRLFSQFENGLTDMSVAAVTFEVPEGTEPSMIVRKNGGDPVRLNRKEVKVWRKAAVSGAVVGGVGCALLGSSVLKAIGLASLGAVGGGLAASAGTLSYYYINKSQSRKNYKPDAPVEHQPVQDERAIHHVISQRKKRVEQQLEQLFRQINENYQQVTQAL